MLHTLLAARFQLRVHRESRDLPVYALVTTRSAPPLRRSTNGDQPKLKSGDKPYQMLLEHFSMSQFALQLGPPWTARPVIDRPWWGRPPGLRGTSTFRCRMGERALA